MWKTLGKITAISLVLTIGMSFMGYKSEIDFQQRSFYEYHSNRDFTTLEGCNTIIIPTKCEKLDYSGQVLNDRGFGVAGIKMLIPFVRLDNADFSHSKLRNSVISGSAEHADFRYADLTNATLRHVNFTGADFSHANLAGADFGQSNLTKANFTGANLDGTYFALAILHEANFSFTDLDKTINMSGVHMHGANLSNTIFSLDKAKYWDSHETFMADIWRKTITFQEIPWFLFGAIFIVTGAGFGLFHGLKWLYLRYRG